MHDPMENFEKILKSISQLKNYRLLIYLIFKSFKKLCTVWDTLKNTVLKRRKLNFLKCFSFRKNNFDRMKPWDIVTYEIRTSSKNFINCIYFHLKQKYIVLCIV